MDFSNSAAVFEAACAEPLKAPGIIISIVMAMPAEKGIGDASHAAREGVFSRIVIGLKRLPIRSR